MKYITVKKGILKSNNKIAIKNKKKLSQKGIFTINLLGSPGSGKTSILEHIINKMKREYKIAVIIGDLYTTKDAQRIDKLKVKVIQINTKGTCHLDAAMVDKALKHLNDSPDFLIIENVGNLVCPASYDLCEDMKITVMSVPEGNDKPLKYPHIFEHSGVVILNKMDILKHTDFDTEQFAKDVKSINQNIKIINSSCETRQGIDELTDYLSNKIYEKKQIIKK